MNWIARLFHLHRWQTVGQDYRRHTWDGEVWKMDTILALRCKSCGEVKSTCIPYTTNYLVEK